jgi:hypothetical protein
MYMVTGAFVLFLVLVRGLTARERPAKRAPKERTLPVVPDAGGPVEHVPAKVPAGV